MKEIIILTNIKTQRTFFYIQSRELEILSCNSPRLVNRTSRDIVSLPLLYSKQLLQFYDIT